MTTPTPPSPPTLGYIPIYTEPGYIPPDVEAQAVKHWLLDNLPPAATPQDQVARDFIKGERLTKDTMSQEEREGVLNALVGKLTRRANDSTESALERKTCLAMLAEIKAVRLRYGAEDGDS